jgi:hypothetical protein
MNLQELPLVLQLDASGNPQNWITYEDSAYYYSKGLVSWEQGEVDITLRGGTSALTGMQSTMKMNTIIAVKGKPSSKHALVSARVPLSNKTLFRRDQHLCAYCGFEFVPNQLTRDHIIPTSKGGKNIWMNVVTACESCNKAKDDCTPEQAKMPLLYVPYEPNRAEYLILQNRKILADQMDFLKKLLPKQSRVLVA